MNLQLKKMSDDIDYLAQQLLTESGVLPTDYYNSSFSDMQAALTAKPREERPVDAGAFARSLMWKGEENGARNSRLPLCNWFKRRWNG